MMQKEKEKWRHVGRKNRERDLGKKKSTAKPSIIFKKSIFKHITGKCKVVLH